MSQATKSVQQDHACSWENDSWKQVAQTINEKWPHISQSEIKKLPCDADAILGFLKEFTDTSLAEIKAVVAEVLPGVSMSDRMASLTGSVTEPLQSAYQRIKYEADEHPAAATGVVFVAGLALGVLGTLAYLRSQPEPTRLSFQNYLPDRWTR